MGRRPSADAAAEPGLPPGPGRSRSGAGNIAHESARRTVTLGPLSDVSRLTLGGGGLGRLWGETTLDEAIATVHAAVDAGITLIDTAPSYRDCEQVIGEAFQGALPSHVRITTKCQLGEPTPGEAAVPGGAPTRFVQLRIARRVQAAGRRRRPEPGWPRGPYAATAMLAVAAPPRSVADEVPHALQPAGRSPKGAPARRARARSELPLEARSTG